MSQFDLMDARPPYIRFERRAVERRKLAEEGGASYFVDIDFALVTAHGSRDTTEKIVEEWFPRLAEEARQGRFNPAWLAAYKESYVAWKNDQEPPLNGTSIKAWPVASPAEVKHLLSVKCLTIEDLATANEEMLHRIGMGARSLKQKAQDWLTGKNGQAPLVAQLDAMRQVIAGLENRLNDASTRTQMLEMQLAAKQQVIADAVYSGTPPVEDRLPPAQDSRAADRAVDDAIEELLE